MRAARLLQRRRRSGLADGALIRRQAVITAIAAISISELVIHRPLFACPMAATGDDFLSDVDPAVQAVVEARVDNQQSGGPATREWAGAWRPRPQLDALSSRHEDPRRPRPARGVSRHA